ncbi:hypothetical protein [Corallococcus sp. EGB]|uniref:hypothetical protein n=1 Tax=Corallococcus sp. EGB TaxID=1521117 RepID=UPI001CC056D8|nr:hypothetical protein [Corallococcus sp. EGB]
MSAPVQRAQSPDPFRTRLDGLLAVALVVWGLAQLAPQLGHPAIFNWDEAIHQAAARGTHDTFFTPHIYKDPLYPSDIRHGWAAHVWMHKPTGPFWFGVLMMYVVGVTPLALRLASLCGHLALPFGWQLVQGRFFGDVTDCTLAGCNAVAAGGPHVTA